MSISLTEDFMTVEELGRSADAILAHARRTGRPVSITVQGKPAAVLLDVVVFEHMLRTLNLVRLVAPGEEDILAGRTRSLDDFMSEFYLANQISGSRQPRNGTGRSEDSRPHRTGQKRRGRKVGS